MKKIDSFTSTMEKHVTVVTPSSTPLGISNKNPKKQTVLRKNKNKKHPTKDLIFNKLVSYLISDSHMYNPLVSSQPTFDFPPPKQISISTGIQEDVALPIKRRNNKLFDKVVDFLEADCYLYSPLISDEHACSKNHAAIKSSGGQLYKGTVQEDGDLSRQFGARPVVKKTVGSVRRSIH